MEGAKNLKWFFEVPEKGEKSRFVQVYDGHTYFDIFEKSTFLPYFEYAESDFEIIFDLQVRLMLQKQPLNDKKSTNFVFKIFDEQSERVKM